MNLLRVQDLAVTRGDRTVLSGVSFTVTAGEVLHVQGRNGVGKTSLLEVLCGIRPPAQSSMLERPDGRDQHWIGHKNALNPGLSPLENLAFWAGLNGVALAEPRAALAAVGLKGQAMRPAGALSTGQKRRAALARLVAAPRAWWFLDEPLAGLDTEGLAIFADLLAKHLATGGAAVVTSHQSLPGNLPGFRALSLS